MAPARALAHTVHFIISVAVECVLSMQGRLLVGVCQEGGVRSVFMVIRCVFSYQALSDNYVWMQAVHGLPFV